MRVFLDANILFSAALTAGAVRRLMHDLHAVGCVLVADGYVWEEARRNLMFRDCAAVAELHALVPLIELHTGVARETGVPGRDAGVPVKRAELSETVQPVITAAVGLGSSVLITGDGRHFGTFLGCTVGGVRIMSPGMAAKEFL